MRLVRGCQGRWLGWVAALVCAGLLTWAPAASADPPANDHFVDREMLSGELPIEISRSNTEATGEAGEFIPGFSPAGNSVWFEWEAESTGWITIGSCDAGFPVILAIFTGSELESLTQVASGNADEGPNCPYSQRQYTFKATSGTSYVIAVDGNNFYPPGASAPETEGEFTLRIEERPPPLNDDFADASALEGAITEEPGGDRFYFAQVEGHNWNATTEAGEQSYGAGSGASVWYSWTAPEDRRYRFSGPCCGLGLNWGLYVGDAVGGLSQVLAATGLAEATVVAGTTYRIGVYGTPDSETAEPSMASFGFSVSAELAPRWLIDEMEDPPGLPPPPSTDGPSIAPDTTPPNTGIVRRVLKRRPPVFVFRFRSNESGSTFRCKLDRQKYRRCGKVKRFRCLRGRRHVLRVFAVDQSGNRDRSPAVTRFKTKCKPHPRPRRKHRQR